MPVSFTRLVAAVQKERWDADKTCLGIDSSELGDRMELEDEGGGVQDDMAYP